MTDKLVGEMARAAYNGLKPLKMGQPIDLDELELNSSRIIDHGLTLQVSGLVDCKGLDRLIKKLSAYKAVLDAVAEDDDSDAQPASLVAAELGQSPSN